jgi:hypothetical protein
VFDQENVREFVNNDREMVTDLRMSSMDWVGSLKHVFVHMLFFFGRQVEPPSNFDMYFFSLENPGLLFQSVLVDVEPTVDGRNPAPVGIWLCHYNPIFYRVL